MFSTSPAGRLAAMLAVAALLAGCGSSSKSDSTSQPASSPPSSSSTPSSSTPSTSTPSGTSSEIVKGAEAKCLEALKKVPAGPARQTGEAACKAIKTQDASGLKARLRKQCLAIAQTAPNGAARQQAEAACAKL